MKGRRATPTTLAGCDCGEWPPQYLELHGSQYRVTYGVPADVRKQLGSRLKRPLGTDSLSKANQLKWSVIQDFKAIIAKTRGIRDGERNALILEAVDWQSPVEA